MKAIKKPFALFLILPVLFVFSLINPQEIKAQEEQAHLTFRSCYDPEDNIFRVFFRADYVAGEYRLLGQNSNFTLNLGHLEVGQTGGGFEDDNTSYVLPVEDTWLKQWFNGSRWQRAGGIPITDIETYTELGYICPVGGNVTYYVTPTPTPTPTETTNPTPAPQEGQVLGAETLIGRPSGRVLGAAAELSPAGLIDLPVVMQLAAVITGVSAAAVVKQIRRED